MTGQALPHADRHRAHPGIVAAGDVVRVGSLAADPAGCPGLVQGQLAELVGEAGMVTSGGKLQVAGPLAHRADAGGQVRVGMPVDLGVAGGRLAGALERGERPGWLGGNEEPRVVKEIGELTGLGGVSGQLAVQVGVGGRPVAGAVGACHGVEQTLVDGLCGADRPRMLLVAFAEPIGQGLVIEPVVTGLAGDDRFNKVVGGGVQQRSDVPGSIAAARPGQRGRQPPPEPGVVKGKAIAAGVGQWAEQIFGAVLLGLAADVGKVLVHGCRDSGGELLPARVVWADRLVAQHQRAAD